VVERNQVFAVEPTLLDEARRLMGRLPFEQLDLLVIGEIGKNYSGAGIDPNVVGRLLVEGAPEPDTPRITRIVALDLSPESHGNATGIGIADLITNRLRDAVDPHVSHMNSLTACFLWRAKVPIEFPTDQECIETGFATCWQPNRDAVRLAFIPNSLEVAELWVSHSLLGDVARNSHLEQTGELQPIPFDSNGNLRLIHLFPHCVAARRNQPIRPDSVP
jgi:hypothetical protein